MHDRPKVGEILLQAGLIDELQLKAALGEQTRWGRRLGVALVKLGFVEERNLTRALAAQLDLPVARLAGKRIRQTVLDLVPAAVAERSMVVPLFVKKEAGAASLFLGMEDPSDLAVLDELSFRTGMQVKPVMVCPSELAEAIDLYYRHAAPGESPDASDGLGAADDLWSTPELELDEERTEPVIEEYPAEAVPVQSSSAERVITSGTEELVLHWTPPETDDVMDVTEEETLPDVEDASTHSAVTSTLHSEHSDERRAVLRDTAVEPSRGGGSTGAPSPYELKTRQILRALTQLLIEKGVMTREDFHARVRDLQETESERR